MPERTVHADQPATARHPPDAPAPAEAAAAGEPPGAGPQEAFGSRSRPGRFGAASLRQDGGGMENKPIGDALDNLAKAEKSLDRASKLLEDNVMNEAQNRERRALAELVAARKMFQKAVSDNPDAFADDPQNDDESPTADDVEEAQREEAERDGGVPQRGQGRAAVRGQDAGAAAEPGAADPDHAAHRLCPARRPGERVAEVAGRLRAAAPARLQRHAGRGAASAGRHEQGGGVVAEEEPDARTATQTGDPAVGEAQRGHEGRDRRASSLPTLTS